MAVIQSNGHSREPQAPPPSPSSWSSSFIVRRLHNVWMSGGNWGVKVPRDCVSFRCWVWSEWSSWIENIIFRVENDLSVIAQRDNLNIFDQNTFGNSAVDCRERSGEPLHYNQSSLEKIYRGTTRIVGKIRMYRFCRLFVTFTDFPAFWCRILRFAHVFHNVYPPCIAPLNWITPLEFCAWHFAPQQRQLFFPAEKEIARIVCTAFKRDGYAMMMTLYL